MMKIIAAVGDGTLLKTAVSQSDSVSEFLQLTFMLALVQFSTLIKHLTIYFINTQKALKSRTLNH